VVSGPLGIVKLRTILLFLQYIFEGLGHLIAKILISSAQYIDRIDERGIQKMCRNIFALQQTLTNITMAREIALDHARHYFELFYLPPEVSFIFVK
jgi:exocyst complex component 4